MINRDNYFKNVYDNIKKHGFHTTYIIEDIDVTPFGYSTGIFDNFKIPEIIISGLPPNLTSDLISNYASKYKFKTPPTNQKIDDLSDRFSVYLIEVDIKKLTEYTLTSIEHYGNREYKFLQLIFPDLDGHFPNDKKHSYDLEIFGEFDGKRI